MQWPASGGRLAVVQIWSREACGPADQGCGEWVAVGEAQRNGGGSREIVEGQEELVNPDITPLLGPDVPSGWKILGLREAIRLWGGASSHFVQTAAILAMSSGDSDDKLCRQQEEIQHQAKETQAHLMEEHQH